MNRDLLLVALSLFTWGIGEGMFYIFQPLYLEAFGASPVQIGAILGAVGVSMAFVQIPAGHLADRFGPHRVMKASWIQGFLATLVLAASPSLPMFTLGLVLYGMTTYVSGPMNAYVGRARGKIPLSRALGINSASFNAGAIIGPLLGGALSSRIGMMPMLRISAAIFFISTCIVLLIRAHPAESSADTPHTSGNLLHNRRFLIFLPLTFLTLFAAYLPQPLTPNYLQNQGGLTMETIGRLASVGSLSNVITLLAGSGLATRGGLVAGQMMLALFALLLWQGTGVGMFSLAYAFFGGFRLLRIMVTTFARPLVSASQTGLAYSLIETVAASAVILGPFVAGLLYERNPSLMYIAAIGLLAASIAANLLLLPRLQRTNPLPAPAAEPEMERNQL